MSITIDKPGTFTATEEEYHADPCPEPSLSSTLAKELLSKTPLHAWVKSPRLNPDFEPENKTAFDLGSAAHTVYTGTGAKIHVIDAPAYTSKAAREERDMAYERGLTPLLKGQWERVSDMVRAGRIQLRAHDIKDPFEGALCEQNFAAVIGGVWCRCRVDALHDEDNILYDFKSTGENPAPDVIGKTISNMGYDLQAAWYRETVEAAIGGRWRFRFVIQEKQPPYLLSVVELSKDWLEMASRRLKRAREVWRRCLDTGEWPGFPAAVAVLDPPVWRENQMTGAEMKEDITHRETGRDLLDLAFKFQAPIVKETTE